MACSFNNYLTRLEMLNAFENTSDPIRRKKVYNKRFNPMVELSEFEFKKKYAMMKLINLVREDIDGDTRGGHISVDLQVMAAIRCWGRNEIQDDGADIHGISQPSLSLICARVARAFASKSRHVIKMPQNSSDQIHTINDFKRIAGFPYVIGAIDCTHIKIQRQGGDSGQYYVNRKGYFSINTQVVCDAHLRIRDIVAHWRGSTHDSRIFRESRIKERLETREFRGRLLGDGGYACTNYLFTPVLNPRNPAEENYNIAHIATRNTVERTFGVWKSRFRILLSGMRGSLKNVKTTIVALAVLHNLAIEYNDTMDDIFETNATSTFPEHNEEENLQIHENVRRIFINTHFS